MKKREGIRARRSDESGQQARAAPEGGIPTQLPSNRWLFVVTLVIAVLSLRILGDLWAIVGVLILPCLATIRAWRVGAVSRKAAAMPAVRVGAAYGLLRGIASLVYSFALGGWGVYSAQTRTQLPPLDALTYIGAVLAQITLAVLFVGVAWLVGIATYAMLSAKGH